MKFGLRNIKSLLASINNPHQRFPAIHIAGTNGKGSTASFIASIFMEAGYKTALYTSPHLVRFTERIRINGIEIPEQRLAAYADLIRDEVENLHATFFEATTCIAFQYFAEEGVEIAVIEAGLGGRLDSTNVLIPLTSIITNVSFDHMEQLGTTLRKIAFEKGGIVKPGVPCITSSTDPIVLNTLKQIAQTKNSRLIESRRALKWQARSGKHGRVTVAFKSSRMKVSNAKLGLNGMHQSENARTAVACIDVLLRRKVNRSLFRDLDAGAVQRGLLHVSRNTGLRGRLHQSTQDPRFFFDVAHNPDGMRTLFSSLPFQNFVAIFGVMRDKEYETMVNILAENAEAVVAVKPRTKRALSSNRIFRLCKKAGVQCLDGEGIAEGIRMATRIAGSRKILVTGSHYVVGEALQVIGA